MINEEDYEKGYRAALASIIQRCYHGLGYPDKDKEIQLATLIVEREEAIAALRIVCERYGDNAWNEQLNLADIIVKHINLYR